MLYKMHNFKVYYALQWKYKKNDAILVLKFGEGNQINIWGWERIQIGIIYTPPI